MAKDNLFEKITKEIPLETRIRVGLHMSFISVLAKERNWERGKEYDKVVEDALEEIHAEADELARVETKHILKNLKEWEKDGKPT